MSNVVATPRVVRVRAWEVVVPVVPGAVNSPALEDAAESEPWDAAPIVLVELTFDDGVIGLGELPRDVTLKTVDASLARLVGLTCPGPSMAAQPSAWRPGNMFGLHQLMPAPAWQSTQLAAAALETALLDATGKRLGCRVVDLLGGAVRQRVSVDYWCGRQTPADLEVIVGRALEHGFRGLKMKSRLGDPVIEQLRVIRQIAGEGFAVTIDPMFQWLSPAHVLPMVKAIDHCNLAVKLEDPFPQDQPQMWQRLRDAVATPLIWHARDAVSLRRGLQARCVDGFNASDGYCWGFLGQAHALEALGLPCWQGSSIELGVAQAARLHACAAAPACVWPSDLVGAAIRQHTLTTWDWPYDAGYLPLPTAPGLGVELDYDAVAHFAQVACDHE
ncbi:enolase C-terminal domain-like protein [Phycisphaerales bacterium AB-hyl4]|uniref:glucarate dehydratase n=1 Tax=Natronomicrosphaera hydrolytica TaxID=3242702 RepID=A0ABV4U915_9BACT